MVPFVLLFLLGKQLEIVRFHTGCSNVDLITKTKVLHVILLNEFKCSEIEVALSTAKVNICCVCCAGLSAMLMMKTFTQRMVCLFNSINYCVFVD